MNRFVASVALAYISYLILTRIWFDPGVDTGWALAATVLWFGLRNRKAIYRDITQRRYNRLKRLKRNGGNHTELEWYRLCARYHWRCARCQRPEKLTKDHIIPVSKGGKDTIDNLQPLCQSCNSSKGRKIVRY